MALVIDRKEITAFPNRLQTLDGIFAATGPDEPGFDGLTRNQKVELLSPCLQTVYTDIAKQYLGVRGC